MSCSTDRGKVAVIGRIVAIACRRASGKAPSSVTARLVAFSLCLLIPAWALAVPVLVCEEPLFDFGEQDNRNTVEHVFSLRNGGDMPLHIGRVYAGCVCASATVGETTLAPGAVGTVVARLVLHGRAGLQEKAFYVHTDDPGTPVLRLEMTGTAMPRITVSPIRADFGSIGRDWSNATRVVTVNWPGGGGFAVTGATCSVSFMTANVTPSSQGYRVELRLNGEPGAGIVRGMARALTDDPACPYVEIPVAGLNMGALVAAPGELRVDRDGWDRPLRLAVRSRNGKPFRVIGVSGPAIDLRYTCSPMPGGYRIEVAPARAVDLHGSELRITTDLGEGADVYVPLIAPEGPGP